MRSRSPALILEMGGHARVLRREFGRVSLGKIWHRVIENQPEFVDFWIGHMWGFHLIPVNPTNSKF